MNQDLYRGSQIDGRVKTLSPDRSATEQAALVQRATDLQAQYNISDMRHPYGCPCCSK
jgi:hypothetical protein